VQMKMALHRACQKGGLVLVTGFCLD